LFSLYILKSFYLAQQNLGGTKNWGPCPACAPCLRAWSRTCRWFRHHVRALKLRETGKLVIHHQQATQPSTTTQSSEGERVVQ